jgi:cytochrome c oxidase subunit 4
MGDHGHDHDHEHKHTSQLGYFGVLMILFVGTALTVLARNVGHANHWGLGFSAFIALLIATTKATFVAYFFMHIRESAKIIMITAVGGVLCLSLLFIFTFGDYLTRKEQVVGTSWESRDQYLNPSHEHLSRPLHTDKFGRFSVLAHSIPAEKSADAASPAKDDKK